MRSDDAPFKEHPIVHWYFRTEIQHRGSPHVHGLLWLENPPKYPLDIPGCLKLIDSLITCDSSTPSVQDVINYQIHHHSKSCKREVRGVNVCRYGIPFLPMDTTRILEPNPEEIGEKEQKEVRDKYQKITNFLNTNKDQRYSFTEYLDKLSMSKEEYLDVISRKIKRGTVFLKRDLKDCFVNPFNEEILSLHKANMDMQFILDPYACVGYIVNYINKSERGVSMALKDAMEEIKRGNLDLKQQLKALGKVFLNASEVSAQECAYSLLKLPLSEMSTGHVFINTKPR